MKNNLILKQFNLDHLVPYNDIKLVDYRVLSFLSANSIGLEDGYQIHDKTLHHVARADTVEMAKLIVDSINFYYSSI